MNSARVLRDLTLCSVLSSLLATGGYAQTPSVSDSAINAILAERIASKRAMGIVVATLELGKAPHIYTSGVSGRAGLPLDGNTVFEIGSITKVFTTTILADMVRKGEVSLSDPIAKYLPAAVHVPERNGRQITLVDLATQ